MANANYVLLERITVGEAGAASVVFNNIPQSGYTDLKVVCSVSSQTGLDHLQMAFNGTSSTYSLTSLRGSGSAVAQSFHNSDYGVTAALEAGYFTSGTFSNTEIYIPNYTSSNQKSVSIDSVQEANSSTAYMVLNAGLWSGTSGINQITFTPQGTSFARYSTFSLYALAAVGTTPVVAPYASGGDIIQTDGTYWYHAFLSSGTFTPAKALSCDILQVAGGGGGGVVGGGGGAGGYLTFTNQAVSTATTVTVGAGGNGGVGNYNRGSAGGNSQFGALTASIGGAGGGGANQNPVTGGSGGGGGWGLSATTGSAGTSGQGNAGASNPSGSGSDGGSGGGGGAGGVGGNSNGGVGLYTAISGGAITAVGQLSGGNYYFAGGGGGSANSSSSPGSGGLGGGGTGAGGGANGTKGINGTGGGGGGGVDPTTNPAGGSGIIVVRYLV